MVAAVLGALVLLHEVSMPAVYVVAFLVGAGEVLTESALQSLVPRLVARSDLERANSRLIATETAGDELAGPPLGALLFAAAPAVPFLLDAASYGGSAVAAGRLARRLPAEARSRVPLRQISGEVIDGLRWLLGHRYLRAMTVWGGVFNIGSAASFSLLVLLALEVLGTGELGYGLLLGVAAGGGLVGTVLAPPLARRIGRGRTILIGAVGSGVTVVAVGLVDDAYIAAALLFANSCCGVMVNVVGRALRQSMVPARLLGRVHSSGRVVVYAGLPLGAALGGWIARLHDLRAAFVVGGLMMTAVSFAVAPWLREELINVAVEATKGDGPV